MVSARIQLDQKYSEAVQLQLNDSRRTYIFCSEDNGAESVNLISANGRRFVLQRASLDQDVSNSRGIAIREYFGRVYTMEADRLENTEICTTYFTLTNTVLGMYYPEHKLIRPLRSDEQEPLIMEVMSAQFSPG